MKIILVNPLWTLNNYIATNLAELGGYLISKGFKDVEIVDLNYELRPNLLFHDAVYASVNIIMSMKPDIVGITCDTVHVPFVSELSKAIKGRLKVPVVLGGIHPTFRTGEMFKLSGADFIVRGEGEETFVELLQNLASDKELQDIKGLSIRRGKRIIHNISRPLMRSLTELPFPAFHLLDKYINQAKKLSCNNRFEGEININASRGCPYNCIFCSTKSMWRFQRRKSPRRVKEEMLYFLKKHKIDKIYMGDDCFNIVHRKWFNDFISEVKDTGIIWSCLTRMDHISPQNLGSLFKGGCRHIYHGIESGSSRIRGILNKKLSVTANSQICRVIKNELQLGFKVTCAFMAGIPTETKRDMEKTVELALAIQRLGAKIQYWIMTPYCNSKAVDIYRNELVNLNRWKRLHQSDVFYPAQFYLFRHYLDRYKNENPDLKMFKPAMPLKDFFKCYLKNRKLLLEHPEDNKIQNLSPTYSRKNFFMTNKKQKYSDRYICLRCRQLSRIDSGCFARLCNGRQIFSARYLCSRREVFELFERLAMFGDINRRNCPYFPSRKRALYLQKIKAIEEKAEKLLEKKEYQKIIILLKRLSAGLSKNWLIYYIEGVAYYKLGRFDIALRYLSKAKLLNPEREDIRYTLAFCLKALQKKT